MIHLYSDARLVGQLNKGSETAFETIFNRYWDHANIISYKATADSEESSEMTQDIIKTLRKHHQTLEVGAMRSEFLSSSFRKFFDFVFNAFPYSYSDGLLNNTISGQYVTLDKHLITLITTF